LYLFSPTHTLSPLLSLVCPGANIWQGYVLDLFVVTASIILELTLRDTFSEIIIVLRLWRVLRILHALYEEIHVNKAHAVKMERKKFERSQSAMTDEP
jgi:hypothetical protein